MRRQPLEQRRGSCPARLPVRQRFETGPPAARKASPAARYAAPGRPSGEPSAPTSANRYGRSQPFGLCRGGADFDDQRAQKGQRTVFRLIRSLSFSTRTRTGVWPILICRSGRRSKSRIPCRPHGEHHTVDRAVGRGRNTASCLRLSATHVSDRPRARSCVPSSARKPTSRERSAARTALVFSARFTAATAKARRRCRASVGVLAGNVTSAGSAMAGPVPARGRPAPGGCQ